MSRYHSYLNSAAAILTAYKGEEPFAGFIKQYFSQHKKFGSKDRKQVSHLCYCFFRMGKALPALPLEERILVALFLCSEQTHEVLGELKPEWNERVAIIPEEKLSFIGHPGDIAAIFPWQDGLSETIDGKLFTLSHLQQPDLFLRLRPGKEISVTGKLTHQGIAFQTISKNCIALSNSTRVDELIEIDRDAVVQDYSSQRVGELIELVRPGQPAPQKRGSDQERLRIWDCCAASGGKSIMAKDILGEIELVVSDIRKSILLNLANRFERAGLDDYERFVADLAKPLSVSLSTFNLVIADVPCSGSGTWGRTPEQLYFFEEEKIAAYAALQQQIVTNALPKVEPGGYFLYITCSVFAMENEEQVHFIKEKFHLQLVKMEWLRGYDKKADTLFAALLKKPL